MIKLKCMHFKNRKKMFSGMLCTKCHITEPLNVYTLFQPALCLAPPSVKKNLYNIYYTFHELLFTQVFLD